MAAPTPYFPKAGKPEERIAHALDFIAMKFASLDATLQAISSKMGPDMKKKP